MKPILVRILLVPLPSCLLVGMSEFVQSVPANVAGFLMRSAAQSVPLRLWPTEYDTQDDVSHRGGPAAIEACGYQVPDWKQGRKGCF